MLTEADLRINTRVYEWTGRTLSLLEKVLKVNIKLYHHQGQLEEGEIFVFNHFARFETFIPQYLLYRETGALCRSVAAADLFQGDDVFRRYLLNLGAVPTDYEGLLPFLAAEVLRGRKVILFPEGGMVKDRRVLDRSGGYSIYSRSTLERRKQHTGAAVVALAVDGFKTAVREAAERGEQDRLGTWAQRLGLRSPDELVEVSRRPTVIVPCNITFYPIRIDQNPLERFAEFLGQDLSPRTSEEIRIEGNILLRDTDMDLRLGDPIRPAERWSWWERRLVRRFARRMESWEDSFSLASRPGGWDGRALGKRMRAHALRVRDDYMAGMYAQVTVNLSHLASRIIFRLLDRGVDRVEAELFHRMLYLAVKNAQQEPSIHLHRSLRNPDAYGSVDKGTGGRWSQFLESASSAGLVERTDERYHFLPKLRQEHGFDEIRLENLVAVYANEVASLGAVVRAVDGAIARASDLGEEALARMRFDDQLRGFRWDWEAFRKPRHDAINSHEQITASGEPFLLLPEGGRRLGVVLVHGFSASPAEVRPLGERLSSRGYPCIGVRLKGHGTSPWDLLERRWEDWLDSVRTGCEILSAFAERLCLVGFSAGGALALRLAAENHRGLAGVVAVAAPVKWRDKTMGLVSVVHGANVLSGPMSAGRGFKPFHRVQPEHPHINYLHKPVRALYELNQLVGEMESHLGLVRCPVLLLQGSEDPVVEPRSADLIYRGLTSAEKTLIEIPATRHGILYEEIGDTHLKIVEFLERLEETP